MAQLFNFVQRPPSERTSRKISAEGAAIIIFPGVRYEILAADKPGTAIDEATAALSGADGAAARH